MKTSKRVVLILMSAMLAGCAGPNGAPGSGIMNGGNINKQDVGTVAGAVGGGVLGSMMGRGVGRTATTIAGTLIGGAVGNSVGKSLDNGDRAVYQQSQQ